MSNIQGSQIWELCTRAALAKVSNYNISHYHHLSKSEVDACTCATIYARHTTATGVRRSQVVWVTGRSLQGTATWTRSDTYLSQECVYDVHVIWRYTVRHQWGSI